MYIMKRKNTNNLFDEMTNLFNDTFNYKSKLLKTDIEETEGAYNFTIDVPGINKKDISVNLEDGYLVVRYEVESTNEENINYIQKERTYASATRSFYIGDIKENSIKAKLNNGVLSIHVPKEEKSSECKKCISIE